MRTILTVTDIKNILQTIFNGNLESSKFSNIPYENPNSEEIVITDADSGISITEDLAKYLGIHFYTWKNRLVEKTIDQDLSTFDEWVQSLNYSFDDAYALVELVDEEVTASQDIDASTKQIRVTFLMQADKIGNLDYYVTKLKNKFLGNPQEIQNAYGDKIKAFITIGSLFYEEEPVTMQLGECIVATCNVKLSYLNDAMTYNDTKVEISLNQGATYLEMPITKITWQKIFSTTALPRANRPDLTGFVSTSLSDVKTLAFYDYNKDLTLALNDLFWRMGAISVDGITQGRQDVNIPIFLKITNNGHEYIYKDVLDNIEKVMTNSDFNISSITLKGWGKN